MRDATVSKENDEELDAAVHATGCTEFGRQRRIKFDPGVVVGLLRCGTSHEFLNDGVLFVGIDVPQFHDGIAHLGGLLLPHLVEQPIGTSRVEAGNQNGRFSQTIPVVHS